MFFKLCEGEGMLFDFGRVFGPEFETFPAQDDPFARVFDVSLNKGAVGDAVPVDEDQIFMACGFDRVVHRNVFAPSLIGLGQVHQMGKTPFLCRHEFRHFG